MEKEFVDWIVQTFSSQNENVLLGPGDDACVLQCAGPTVVSTDTLADGTHFRVGEHSWHQIGHKAIAVNLSDLAAMGARPIAATVHFTCPRNLALSDLQALYRRMVETAAAFDMTIAGGDTNRWDGPLVLGATVFGDAWPTSRTGFWKMSGGRAGDWIFVSGTLGGSIEEKHVAFTPRVSEARQLMERYKVNAATDITDSLSLDLAGLARRSGCGFQLHSQSVPISNAAIKRSLTSVQSPLEHALYDGEDFELLVCLDENEAQRLRADQELSVEWKHIGYLTDRKSFSLTRGGGQADLELEIRGYVH